MLQNPKHIPGVEQQRSAPTPAAVLPSPPARRAIRPAVRSRPSQDRRLVDLSPAWYGDWAPSLRSMQLRSERARRRSPPAPRPKRLVDPVPPLPTFTETATPGRACAMFSFGFPPTMPLSAAYPAKATYTIRAERPLERLPDNPSVDPRYIAGDSQLVSRRTDPHGRSLPSTGSTNFCRGTSNFLRRRPNRALPVRPSWK